MTEQPTNPSILSSEQREALTETQYETFMMLDDKDQAFFAANFSPASLGSALERKLGTLKGRARIEAHDQAVRSAVQARANAPATESGLSAGLAGAAGMAAVVGLGAVAQKIAPQGKATWRGVSPRDLVNPLIDEFGSKDRTDIRFNAPSAEGNLGATIFLRTSQGPVPAITVALAQLTEACEVQVTKISTESLLQTLKGQGGKLFDLVQEGLRLRKTTGDAADLMDLAGRLFEDGVDGAQAVKDLDLEDRTWETVLRVAEPLQKVYDQRKELEVQDRTRLERAWDDHYICPKCKVEFSTSEEITCRVCGAARPMAPDVPDPRRM